MRVVACDTAVRLAGLHMHIGSQIVQVEPYVDALQRLLAFLPECAKAGHRVETLDLGFSGTSDRLSAPPVIIPPCPP